MNDLCTCGGPNGCMIHAPVKYHVINETYIPDDYIVKRLQEKGSMPKSSQTAPDCLHCMNGKTLQNEEKCQECGRYVDNYGELFPMR